MGEHADHESDDEDLPDRGTKRGAIEASSSSSGHQAPTVPEEDVVMALNPLPPESPQKKQRLEITTKLKRANRQVMRKKAGDISCGYENDRFAKSFIDKSSPSGTGVDVTRILSVVAAKERSAPREEEWQEKIDAEIYMLGSTSLTM